MQPKKNILHVVSTADFIDHFLYDNIIYCGTENVRFTIACTPNKLLLDLAKSGEFDFASININRSYTPLADFFAVRKLRRLIKQNGFDIVIGHTPKGALLSMIAAKLEKVPIRIYYRHGILYQTATGLKRTILKLIEKLTAYCSTGIINVSRSVETFAIENRLNVSTKNIFLGTNGSCGAVNAKIFSREFLVQNDLNSFRKRYGFTNDHIVVGYFGRMVKDKGINDLIDAWLILTKEFSNVKLLLAGEYEERDTLSAYSKDQINSNSTILFLDYYKEVNFLYGILDIFVLPSYREGLPTVILEASAMEVPIITTKVTGCIDAIVENETGLFCTHEPQNIAEKIKFYIEHPEVRKMHGQNGRKFVLTYFDQATIWRDFDLKVLKL